MKISRFRCIRGPEHIIRKRSDRIVENIREELKNCEYLLIGLGSEWEAADGAKRKKAYEALVQLTEGKEYFVVTLATDAKIFESGLKADNIVAPCGNVTWQQCPDACTKDIWELGEVADGCCPHCGKALIANTIRSEHYIEEGYLPQWKRYQEWLAGTLHKKLLILELGVGFQTPTVIRWPFEKLAFFNQRAHMYRVNKTFYQITEELKERAVPVQADSVKFVCDLAAKH